MMLLVVLAVGCSDDLDLYEEDQIDVIPIATTRVSNGQVISLKANNNKYVCSENGAIDMRANRDEIAAWEKFTVSIVGSSNGNDVIALKANNNKYVSAISSTADMKASKTSIGNWEKFEVIDLGSQNGNDLIALKANSGNYVCSENGAIDMKADREEIGAWEKFEVITDGGNSSGSFTFSNIQIETSDNCSSNSDNGTTSKDATNTSQSGDFSGKYSLNSNGSYKLTSCPKDGKRTEWKMKPGNEFAFSDNRTMEYNASFSDYPSGGVTIAQLHCRGDAERPFIRVEILNGKIVCVMTTDYEKNQGDVHTVNMQSYSSGSAVKVKIQTKTNWVRVTTTTGGTEKTATYTTNNSNIKKKINSNWLESGVKNDFYFKAGVYNDSGDGSKTPDGTFTSFEID